jgi:hypothetical protein
VNESHARIEYSLVAFNLRGDGVFAYDDPGHASNVEVVCSDVFGNVTDNYGGTLEDQTGINGNISADPMFCDAGGADFRLSGASPCLPENNECGVLIGAHGQGCATVGIDGSLAAGDAADRLRIRPNPAMESASISFDLPVSGPVRLSIHDSAGRLVRDLLIGADLAAGRHEALWDGIGADGRPAPAGTYFCRFAAGASSSTAALILLRR